MLARKEAAIFMAVLVALTVCALGYFSYQEAEYQRTTPPEVRAQHEEMAQRLREAETGAFVVLETGDVICVGPNPSSKTRGSVLKLQDDRYDGLVDKDVRFLGRYATKIVPPEDPEWPKLARKFLTGEE